MRCLLPLLLAATTAATTLKGTQHRHRVSSLRLLKKEEELHTAAPTTVKPTVEPTAFPTPTPSLVPTLTPSSESSTVAPTGSSSSAPTNISTQPLLDASDLSDDIETSAPFVVTKSPSTSPSSIIASGTNVSTEAPTLVTETNSNTISTEESTANDDNDDTTAIDIASISIIPLKPFRVDFVSTVRHDDDDVSNTNNNSTRQLRAQQSARNLAFFGTTQDAELIHVISNHIQSSLRSFGDVLAVQLKIMDKVESVFGHLDEDDVDGDVESNSNNRKLLPELSLILVSYTFEGEVLIGGAAPDYAKIEEVMLQSFTSEEEKTSLLKTLTASTDDVLQSVTDVDATSVILSVNNEIQSTNNNANESKDNSEFNLLFPMLIGVAFFSTLGVIAFLVHRKYHEYRNNEYASYQQRKRNLNAYDHFESDCSVTENVSPTSREHDAVFTHDFDIEESSIEDERGWSSTSTSIEELDWNAPFDDSSLGARQVPYEDQTKMELRMIQMGTNVEEGGLSAGMVRSVPVVDESRTDITLDGLYSTSDSYFDGSAVKSRSRRCDSIDTLNCSTDQSAFGPGWEREVKFEGVLQVMDRDELVTDVTKILLQNNDALQTPQLTREPQERLQIDDEEESPSTDSISSKQSSAYKSMYTSSDPTAISKANISAGIFTEETLGMINRNRLKSTPPPSENEYDEEVVNDAKEHTLLGQWRAESDSEEDILFEDV
eukprot:scaffold33374_cov47-Cyclotella_meneghiniana.AAC.3